MSLEIATKYNEDDNLLVLAKIFNLKLVNKNFILDSKKVIFKVDAKLANEGILTIKEYNITLIAVFNNKIAIEHIMQKSSNKIFLIKIQHFYQVLEQYFKNIYLAKTVYLLDFITNKKTAKNLAYNRIIIFFILFFTLITCVNSNISIYINIIFYLTHNLLKVLLLSSYFNKKKFLLQASENYNGEYPVYSILIPMYKEVAKFTKILAAIDNLDYPKRYLDVKIILEEDDISMIREVSLHEIPFYVQIIKTPKLLPRTKPKALNYAMNFVRGEYLVVYDADDEPEPQQLKNSVIEFKSLPENYICLQSNLNFYNANENLLTSCMALEYYIWFAIILKGLNFFNLPMPLGGTSNHFKTSKLKDIGLWDSHNVTEDTDLGLKIYQLGYKSKIYNSITFEEAPIELKIWFYQRVRWIKGFLQTFLIHIMLIKHNNIKSKIIIWGFIGFSVQGFLITPLLLIMYFYNAPIIVEFINISLCINVSFVILSAICALKNIRYNKSYGRLYYLCIIVIFPFYFLLHSIASYYAVWELIIKPFHWNKTTHGLSKII
jgi:cellulose synthase/poly-beta-1,6-N-acetylglucosamine synthase-like glycosyltransferase